jgi:hypothetical protein
MSRRYKVLLPLLVHTEDGSYKQGQEFDKDFTADEEAANVESGLLEIVPQEYKVVGGSNVHGANPGETFKRALSIGEEYLLIAGGHIKRVKTKETKTKK